MSLSFLTVILNINTHNYSKHSKKDVRNIFISYYPTDARVRALAAAWARRDHELVDALLENRSTFGLVEVLKAASVLDAGRQIRAVEKVMMQLQMQKAKVKPKKLGKLKSTIDNLTAIKPKVCFIAQRQKKGVRSLGSAHPPTHCWGILIFHKEETHCGNLHYFSANISGDLDPLRNSIHVQTPVMQ